MCAWHKMCPVIYVCNIHIFLAACCGPTRQHLNTMFGQTSCQDEPELTRISLSAVIVESVCVCMRFPTVLLLKSLKLLGIWHSVAGQIVSDVSSDVNAFKHHQLLTEYHIPEDQFQSPSHIALLLCDLTQFILNCLVYSSSYFLNYMKTL